MSVAHRTYTDRFGNTWAVQRKRRAGVMTFSCGAVELLAADGEAAARAPTGSDAAELKELFCDAERPFTHEDQQWYVGYRTRMGKGGRVQGGLHTRFRSAAGEVRFAKEVLLFRQMPVALLRKHLAVARPAGRPPTAAADDDPPPAG